MHRIQGAYSLVILTKDKLFAVRDPFGVRPLCLGKINGYWVVASESCALDHIGALFVRDIEPGEIVVNRCERRQKLPGDHRKKSHLYF